MWLLSAAAARAHSRALRLRRMSRNQPRGWSAFRVRRPSAFLQLSREKPNTTAPLPEPGTFWVAGLLAHARILLPGVVACRGGRQP